MVSVLPVLNRHLMALQRDHEVNRNVKHAASAENNLLLLPNYLFPVWSWVACLVGTFTPQEGMHLYNNNNQNKASICNNWNMQKIVEEWSYHFLLMSAASNLLTFSYLFAFLSLFSLSDGHDFSVFSECGGWSLSLWIYSEAKNNPDWWQPKFLHPQTFIERKSVGFCAQSLSWL